LRGSDRQHSPRSSVKDGPYTVLRTHPIVTDREPPMVREPAADSGAAIHAAMCGTDPATYIRERPGMSAFALEDAVVYHT
jgi:hypothetical protein